MGGQILRTSPSQHQFLEFFLQMQINYLPFENVIIKEREGLSLKLKRDFFFFFPPVCGGSETFTDIEKTPSGKVNVGGRGC